MSEEAELLPGTLDLLILKAVSLGPLHVMPSFPGSRQISGKAVVRRARAWYPATVPLVRQDCSTNNRFPEICSIRKGRHNHEAAPARRL